MWFFLHGTTALVKLFEQHWLLDEKAALPFSSFFQLPNFQMSPPALLASYLTATSYVGGETLYLCTGWELFDNNILFTPNILFHPTICEPEAGHAMRAGADMLITLWSRDIACYWNAPVFVRTMCICCPRLCQQQNTSNTKDIIRQCKIIRQYKCYEFKKLFLTEQHFFKSSSEWYISYTNYSE